MEDCKRLESEFVSLKRSIEESSMLKEHTVKDELIVNLKLGIEENKRIADMTSSDLEVKTIECHKLEEK